MDGLLLDSEPFWVQSEKDVFKSVGVELTGELCHRTFGMRIQEVAPYWHRQFPWDTNKKSFESVANEVMDLVINLINEKAKPFAGVDYILDFFESKNIPLAIASSSAMRIIDAVMDKLCIRERFKVIYSAENEKYGKPHPGVYITTAEKMGVEPVDCAAFEDSFNGLISAKAAKMKTVAVPELTDFYHPQFNIADVKLRKLTEFTDEEFKKLNEM
jgi:sugar-phosphatase